MSDFSEAFAEVKRVVQPDVDPVLTYGDGTTPDPTKELDSIILASARAMVWQASLAVKYGDIVVPTVGNGRRYRVVTAGTLGSTEPSSWPDYDYGSVESGTATLEEDGRFVGSIYDVRAAIRECARVMKEKWRDTTDVSADGRSIKDDQVWQRLDSLERRHSHVGIA